MTFRAKLFVASALTLLVAVGLVAWTVTVNARRAFERMDDDRTTALVGQFQREFERRGQEVAQRVAAIAGSGVAHAIAIELSAPQPDFSQYVNEAQDLASTNSLDFLELLGPDGAIISSAQWTARFGYKEDWIGHAPAWAGLGAFLKREELSTEPALALIAVRTASAGDQLLYIAGGQRLDEQFLASLVLPAGMRAMLYRNLDPSFNARYLSGATAPAGHYASLIEQVRQQRREIKARINDDAVHAIPLAGPEPESPLLGVLLVSSSRRELIQLENSIRMVGLGVGAAGILFGALLSWWASARITRPVKRLADGAREVAGGNWDARVDVRSRDEIGELAGAFNEMTRQLIEQRGRLVQAERVAAWRELARRLAHELKNPLFPLQITIENLQRARQQSPEQFEEVFRESTSTLLAELANLKTIIGRFSDFSKMPRPQLESVDVNQLVRDVAKFFEPQLSAPGHPPVRIETAYDDSAPNVPADPEQVNRALRNLVLNAMDAMPEGGTITLRTKHSGGHVCLEVSDSGVGLTSEECERLFTPYYTTKHHGTGLGLAIVQSVVSDHGGKISVESQPGRGTSFRIELKA